MPEACKSYQDTINWTNRQIVSRLILAGAAATAGIYVGVKKGGLADYNTITLSEAKALAQAIGLVSGTLIPLTAKIQDRTYNDLKVERQLAIEAAKQQTCEKIDPYGIGAPNWQLKF
jgi:hypothetical protein